MNCETFWQTIEAQALLGEPLPPELDTHLAHCPRCRQELERMAGAMVDLKAELAGEEPAAFWHEMRSQVREAVRPRKKFSLAWIISWLPARQWWGVPVAAALLVVLMLSRPATTPLTLTEEEIPLLVGVVPAASLFDAEEWGMELPGDGGGDASVMPSLDGWDDLLFDLSEGVNI